MMIFCCCLPFVDDAFCKKKYFRKELNGIHIFFFSQRAPYKKHKILKKIFLECVDDNYFSS